MALVPCRECAKSVSEEAVICPSCGVKTPNLRRYLRRRYTRMAFVATFVIADVAGYFMYANHTASDSSNLGTGSSPSSSIKKDLPIKDQVIQKDDKAIVRELLDSGERVGKISKETGIRRDEIRRIKKEKQRKEEEDRKQNESK